MVEKVLGRSYAHDYVEHLRLYNPFLTVSFPEINDVFFCLSSSVLPEDLQRNEQVFKNIKRLRKISDSWKTGAVTPIYKKRDRRKVANYGLVSLQDNDSKLFGKCIYKVLYIQFTFYLTKHQQGLVNHRSVLSRLFSFLKNIHEALDSDPTPNLRPSLTSLKPLTTCLIINSSKRSPKPGWAGVYLKSWSTTLEIASSL